MSAGSAGASPFAYDIERLRFRYRHSAGAPGHRGDPSGSDWVLKGLTFEVQAGEVLGIIGPNGSGKTSLLKLLGKVLLPQEGRIRLFGQDLQELAPDAIARTVAQVPQDSHIIFPFTIAETVMMGRFPHHCQGGRLSQLAGFGWESQQDLRLVARAMEDTDVAHLAHRPIGEVSGGERQRAILARALTQEPKVLLLDEPTVFLDLNHQVEICQILRRLNEERQLTILLVSHDLNLASQYCDRLLLLAEGRIVRLGTPEEVIRPDILEGVYGCTVLVDGHPDSGLPRITLPGYRKAVTSDE